MFEFLGSHEIVHLVEHFMHAWHRDDQNEELRQRRLKREYEDKRRQSRESVVEEEEERRQYEAELAVKHQTRREQEALEAEAARQKAGQPEEVSKPAENRKAVAVLPPTVAQISEGIEVNSGIRLGHDQILQAMKTAEDQFVHWTHPEHPDMTRFALREHAEVLGLQNWQPGVGI